MKKVLRERSEKPKSLLTRSPDMDGRSESSSKHLRKAENELHFWTCTEQRGRECKIRDHYYHNDVSTSRKESPRERRAWSSSSSEHELQKGQIREIWPNRMAPNHTRSCSESPKPDCYLAFSKVSAKGETPRSVEHGVFMFHETTNGLVAHI